MNNKQLKEEERFSGIPTDEWLDNPKVYASKKKHLQTLKLLRAESKQMLVFDAGCGPGTYGVILAKQPNFNVVGVDISKAAIRKAQERAFRKNVHFCAVEGDLESLPFGDATFDIIFAGWTLHHFPSLDRVCSELQRVLKPGGKVAIVEPNEVNLIMKCSRLVENTLRPLVLKIGWDTPNRTIHTYKDYIAQLASRDFTDLELYSCYTSLPPIISSNNFPLNTGLKLIYFTRTFLFWVATGILPRPMNGPDLIITGTKLDMQTSDTTDH